MLDPRIIELMPEEGNLCQGRNTQRCYENCEVYPCATHGSNQMRQDIIDSLDGKVILIPSVGTLANILKTVCEDNNGEWFVSAEYILKMLESGGQKMNLPSREEISQALNMYENTMSKVALRSIAEAYAEGKLVPVMDNEDMSTPKDKPCS